tara:strand:- start:307 stop:1455 length:1149 start_codon:yes stop_codon:yes gene_type:complete
MKILLNIDTILSNSGGIGIYTKFLLRGLMIDERIKELIIYPSLNKNELSHLLNANSLLPQSFFSTRLKPYLRKIKIVRSTFRSYKNLLFYLKNYNSDAIYHEPNFFLHNYSGKKIATIHDLSFLENNNFHPKDRIDFMKSEIKKTVNHADHLITDTNAIKNQLIDTYSVDPSRITTIHLGVERTEHNSASIARFLKKHNLYQDSYILSVATIEPRKNIDSILSAYFQLDSSIRNKYPLVIVGKEGWNTEATMTRIRQLVLANKIRYLNYVSDLDICYLQRAARATIYVPYYEGFGLPPLESMASGVPALVSSIKVIREVCGDSVYYADPFSPDSIKVGLEAILLNESIRDNLKKLGEITYKKYSWSSTVSKTIDLYEKISTN